MDRYGVIWTRVSGKPEKLCDMVLTPSELRITKTQDAIVSRLPGVSLLHDMAGQPDAVFLRSDHAHLPPQLQFLLPPPDETNPVRRVYAQLLSRAIETRGMPVMDRDWQMLLMFGRNAAGHLDVFGDDDRARDYYARQGAGSPRLIPAGSIWTAFKNFISGISTEDEIETVQETVGATPGVSGMMPKLATGILLDSSGAWHGDLMTAAAAVQVIVKVEKNEYPGLLSLEQLAYSYHARAGFDVPRCWLKTLDIKGQRITLLATERFDRANGLPLPLASFFSVLNTGNPSKFFSATSGTMENVSKVFDRLRLPYPMKLDWYKRFVMTFLTGNGDLHTENMSLLGAGETLRLSPVYDPAPMRAYRSFIRNHDLLSALPFSGIGGLGEVVFNEYALSGDTPPDLGDRLIRFGVNIGIDSGVCREAISHLVAQTTDFAEEAASLLCALPQEQRRNPRSPDVDGFLKTMTEVKKAIIMGDRPRFPALG